MFDFNDVKLYKLLSLSVWGISNMTFYRCRTLKFSYVSDVNF